MPGSAAGNVLGEYKRYEESLAAYDRALALILTLRKFGLAAAMRCANSAAMMTRSRPMIAR